MYCQGVYYKRRKSGISHTCTYTSIHTFLILEPRIVMNLRRVFWKGVFWKGGRVYVFVHVYTYACMCYERGVQGGGSPWNHGLSWPFSTERLLVSRAVSSSDWISMSDLKVRPEGRGEGVRGGYGVWGGMRGKGGIRRGKGVRGGKKGYKEGQGGKGG